MQPTHQVRVTREKPAKEQRIVPAGLQHTPAVLVVPAPGREERCGAEDLAEGVEVDIFQAPACQEFVFFFVAEDLLVALRAVSFYMSVCV